LVRVTRRDDCCHSLHWHPTRKSTLEACLGAPVFDALPFKLRGRASWPRLEALTLGTFLAGLDPRPALPASGSRLSFVFLFLRVLLSPGLRLYLVPLLFGWLGALFPTLLTARVGSLSCHRGNLLARLRTDASRPLLACASSPPPWLRALPCSD